MMVGGQEIEAKSVDGNDMNADFLHHRRYSSGVRRPQVQSILTTNNLKT